MISYVLIPAIVVPFCCLWNFHFTENGKEIAGENLSYSCIAGRLLTVNAGSLERLMKKENFWPPYRAGGGIGVTLLASFVIGGQGRVE